MKLVAVDTETAGLSAKLDSTVPLFCVGFSHEDGESYVLKGQSGVAHLNKLAQDEEVVFVFHNAAFDVPVLRLRGASIQPGKYCDTMVLSYVLAPGPDGHSLEDWGLKLGYEKIDLLQQLKDLRFLPQTAKKGDEFKQYHPLMDEYCLRDVEITMKLALQLLPKLEEMPRTKELYETVELPYVETIIEMESTGLFVDRSKLAPLRASLQQRIRDLTKQILTIVPHLPGDTTEYARGSYKNKSHVPRTFYPGRDRTEFPTDTVYNHCSYEPFNPNSGQQVATALQLIYGWEPEEFTATGQAKTGASVLEELEYPLAHLLTEHAELVKIEGTFLTAFDERATSGGVLRGSFNQCKTRTGRLSSSDPNLQNIPVRSDLGKELRSLVTTPNPERVLLIDGDLSNIEGRVLAFYLENIADDPYLGEVFRSGQDFHQANADRLGVERQEAKLLLYLFIYGGGAAKLSVSLGITLARATWMIEQLKSNFTSLLELRDEVVRSAKSNRGVVHTLLGRRLVYPDLISKNRSFRARAERQVFNAVLQGTAADIQKKLMLESANLVHAYGARIAAAVHDETLIYSPAAAAPELAKDLTQKWSSSKLLDTVPITAEFKYGTSWSELH